MQPYSSSAQTPSLAGALPATLLLCLSGFRMGCWFVMADALQSCCCRGRPGTFGDQQESPRAAHCCGAPLWGLAGAACPLGFSLLLPSMAGISSP